MRVCLPPVPAGCNRWSTLCNHADEIKITDDPGGNFECRAPARTHQSAGDKYVPACI